MKISIFFIFLLGDMMNVKSMDMAWISVKDPKKAKEFFRDILGLELRSEAEEYGWMEFVGKDGGAALGVGKECPESSDVKAGQNAVMTMTVDDIVACKKYLESKGVKFIGDIIEVPGHVKMALFADNDGNKFQIVQVLDGHK